MRVWEHHITLPVQNWLAERLRANDNARTLDPTPANVLCYRKRTDIRHYGMWVTRPFVMESAEMADRLLPVTAPSWSPFIKDAMEDLLTGGNVVVPRYDAKRLVLGTVLSLPHTVCICSQGSPYSIHL